jgi:hypothetical protein
MTLSSLPDRHEKTVLLEILVRSRRTGNSGEKKDDRRRRRGWQRYGTRSPAHRLLTLAREVSRMGAGRDVGSGRECPHAFGARIAPGFAGDKARAAARGRISGGRRGG